MADIKILNPDALGKPLGQYSHLTRVKASEFVFIAGQVGVDSNGKLVGDGDFDAQCVQTSRISRRRSNRSAQAGEISSSSRPTWCTRRIFRSS